MGNTRDDVTPRHVGLMHTMPFSGSDNRGTAPYPTAKIFRLLSAELLTSNPSCDWNMRAELGLKRTSSSWKPLASVTGTANYDEIKSRNRTRENGATGNDKTLTHSTTARH